MTREEDKSWRETFVQLLDKATHVFWEEWFYGELAADPDPNLIQALTDRGRVEA